LAVVFVSLCDPETLFECYFFGVRRFWRQAPATRTVASAAAARALLFVIMVDSVEDTTMAALPYWLTDVSCRAHEATFSGFPTTWRFV
jgi:hypothetical protein